MPFRNQRFLRRVRNSLRTTPLIGNNLPALGLFLMMMVPVSHAGQQTDPGTQAEIKAAKAAILEFAGALQAELKSAMKAGGPVAAIAVCNGKAMPITQQIAIKHGMQLSRVSLRNRNPANAPNEWQLAVLEDFEQRKRMGKEIETLAWSETTGSGGDREFRFMRAIPTGSVCLQCHGTKLSPDISRTITGLYPRDRATGFREGDIRGAFVVTRKLTN